MSVEYIQITEIDLDRMRSEIKELTDEYNYIKFHYGRLEKERNVLKKKLEYTQEILKVIENHKAGNQDECKYCWDMKIIAKEALAEIEHIGKKE